MVYGQIRDSCAVNTMFVDDKINKVVLVVDNPSRLARNARAGNGDGSVSRDALITDLLKPLLTENKLDRQRRRFDYLNLPRT